MTTNSDNPAGEPARSTLYVDMENLAGKGQSLLVELLSNWPDKAPKPSVAHLYVKADQVGLWSVWGEGQFDDVKIVPHGVQHFSKTSTKNSADVALVIDAISDLLIGTTEHITVVSDDSDFLALYSAMISRPNMPFPDEAPPFLLVVTGDNGKQSETIRSFVPAGHLHVISSMAGSTRTSSPQDNQATMDESVYQAMARKIIETTSVGYFKSTQCRSLIGQDWPEHNLATADSPKFGTEFRAKIWPHIEGAGGRIPNPNEKPIKYEMTQEAKDSL